MHLAKLRILCHSNTEARQLLTLSGPLSPLGALCASRCAGRQLCLCLAPAMLLLIVNHGSSRGMNNLQVCCPELFDAEIPLSLDPLLSGKQSGA